MTTATDDRHRPAGGVIAGAQLSNGGIRSAEPERSRHALAHPKRKIGDDAMRDLLEHDPAVMTKEVRGCTPPTASAVR